MTGSGITCEESWLKRVWWQRGYQGTLTGLYVCSALSGSTGCKAGWVVLGILVSTLNKLSSRKWRMWLKTILPNIIQKEYLNEASIGKQQHKEYQYQQSIKWCFHAMFALVNLLYLCLPRDECLRDGLQATALSKSHVSSNLVLAILPHFFHHNSSS